MYYVMQLRRGPGAPRDIKLSQLAPLGIYMGKPLPRPFPNVRVTLSSLYGINDVWGIGDYLVMANKTLDILRTTGETHFETFPVELPTQHGRRDNESFRMVNLLDNVPCMDMRASAFTRDEGGLIDGISRLVILAGNVPDDRQFFQLAESADLIIAGEKVVREFTRHKVSGVRFVKPEEIGT